MIVGIIGAGASGMVAALAAAENKNTRVILFERQARVGKKLLATGNGRCNLTNLHADARGYHGEDDSFPRGALTQFDVKKTLAWFQQLGLFTVTEDSGKVYPYSDQANSVVDVLRFALNQENITVRTGFEVKKLRRQDGGFLVQGDEETVLCDRLIVACGGLAGTKLGGSMAGYKLLAQLGHRATRLRPALVQLKTDWSGIASLKGVRANCRITILRDGVCFSSGSGEIQFADYGISGPVVFEVSRDVCYGSGEWIARLDFLPGYETQTLLEALRSRTASELSGDELLTGILHNRLGKVLTRAVGIRDNRSLTQLTDGELKAVCAAVKGFDIPLTEPMGMDSAQVTAGGVITADFDPATLESKKVPGLYACGEVLDVDGDCGGYNLQWAWSSGYVAGRHAGRETI